MNLTLAVRLSRVERGKPAHSDVGCSSLPCGARCRLTRMAGPPHSIRIRFPDRIVGPANAERTAVCVCLAVECVRAALVPSAARDLPASDRSLRELGSLWVRQGCDRDQAVEHVTQILAGDEMVAPAVQLLPGRRSIGPLRWRGHPDSFAVHRAVQVSFLATPVLDYPLPALVRLVEHTTRIRDEEASRHYAVGYDEMTRRRTDADDDRAHIERRLNQVHPSAGRRARHVLRVRRWRTYHIASFSPLDVPGLQIMRGDRVELEEVDPAFRRQFHLSGRIGFGPERLCQS